MSLDIELEDSWPVFYGPDEVPTTSDDPMFLSEELLIYGRVVESYTGGGRGATIILSNLQWFYGRYESNAEKFLTSAEGGPTKEVKEIVCWMYMPPHVKHKEIYDL